MVLRRKDPLAVFIQHGAQFHKQNSTNSVGDCPLCGKAMHFCANPETKAWDCKSCGKNGGFQTFLREIAALSIEEFRGRPALDLSKDRGLRISTLRRFDIGFNPAAGKYVIPIPFSDEAGGYWDLRCCRLGRPLITTAGCKLGIFNWQRLKEASRVWLAEGEWDAMALEEILRGVGAGPEEIAIGIPGAGTFKQEWVSLFAGKEIIVAYDRDDPGEAGEIKVYNALAGDVASLKFHTWPEGTADGFDVRDLYLTMEKNVVATYASLTADSSLSDKPRAAEEKDLKVTTTTSPTFKGTGLPASAVYDKYRQWFHLPDIGLVDVVFGTTIANRIAGTPLWVFLIAPPGATKTAMLLPLSGAPGIVTASTMTPHALVSGASLAGGADPSILAQFHRTRGKILVIKDFTPILNMPQQNREEAFGLFRDAFDGEIKKVFGHGVVRHYFCEFGILAGVTPAIEQYLEFDSALGPRFLGYRIPLPRGMKERRKYILRAQSNVGREPIMKSELSEISRIVLDHDFGAPLDVPSTLSGRIVALADLTSLMRGTVPRDRFSKDVTHKAFSELGTRLVQQLTKLGIGVAQFRRAEYVDERAFEIVRRIAMGSIPRAQLGFLSLIWEQGRTRAWTPRELSSLFGLPEYPTGRRIVQNLEMLEVLRRVDAGGMGTKGAYMLEEEVADAIAESGAFDTREAA